MTRVIFCVTASAFLLFSACIATVPAERSGTVAEQPRHNDNRYTTQNEHIQEPALIEARDDMSYPADDGRLNHPTFTSSSTVDMSYPADEERLNAFKKRYPHLEGEFLIKIFKQHTQQTLATLRMIHPNHTEKQLMEELVKMEEEQERMQAEQEKMLAELMKTQEEIVPMTFKEKRDLPTLLPRFSGAFERTPLIQQLQRRYPEGTVTCVTTPETDCGMCGTFCSFKSDSVTIHYQNGGLTDANVQVRDVAMLDGKVKIGMSWDDFVKATGTTAKYREPMTLKWNDEFRQVDLSFRFEKGILLSATYSVETY